MDESPTTCTLNMRELLEGDVNRLRYITRYSTNLQMHRENVAEHCFFVSLYAMAVGRWVIAKGDVPVTMGILLEKCLCHDLDECRTGDFQRPFKYRSTELREMIEKVAREEVIIAISGVFPEDGSLQQRFIKAWETAKDHSTEGLIVAYADFLSVLSHMRVNQIILRDYESMLDYARTFLSEEYDFIRELVDQSNAVLKEVTGFDITA